MSKSIMNAIMAEANANEAKALANLQVYMSNPAGIGEHPDVVGECAKLVKTIAEAREVMATVSALTTDPNAASEEAPTETESK